MLTLTHTVPIRYDRGKLALHCSREYKWDNKEAAFYVNEFLDKFIPIKRFLKDFDSIICSPPPLLDKVWRIALLYTREYRSLCGKNFIEYSPDVVFDMPAVKSERFKATLNAYTELFGDSIDHVAWDCQSLTEPPSKPSAPPIRPIDDWKPRKRAKQDGRKQDELPFKDFYLKRGKPLTVRARQPRSEILQQEPASKGTTPNTEPFQICIRMFDGKTTLLNVCLDYTIKKLKSLIKDRVGIPEEFFQLTFVGKLLKDEMKLEKYGVCKDSTIHVCLKMRG